MRFWVATTLAVATNGFGVMIAVSENESVWAAFFGALAGVSVGLAIAFVCVVLAIE